MANPTTESIVEAVLVPAANKGMLVGAATGVAGWLSQVNWIGLSGVLVAVLGLIISAYFQIRRDRRETIESQERIRLMRDQCQR